MSVRGKSINLFLIDGTPSGRIKCTLANWTGVAYQIPRTELDKCKGRRDLSQSGVYFLFGTSEETGGNAVYIGQAGVRKNVRVSFTVCWNINVIKKKIIGQRL
ncbi:hypothetical protein SLU01_11800 [Sporosarcina luteola]|uniref:GIY-YIG domain-containing protein n=1 Tax=Sporosarcina luteola TaxID=582850 RepID=A0A511Z5Y2_9BACL|nr:hypothetical protein [Sporosarcina luteola]GEN82868.1 hypothetical protein SLU01_11800 [Sporosarcina luteola]